MYKRKTKDVFCRKCGHSSLIPIDGIPKDYCCILLLENNSRCLGTLKLKIALKNLREGPGLAPRRTR